MSKLIKASLLSIGILSLGACSTYYPNDEVRSVLTPLPEYKTAPTNLNEQRNMNQENKNIYFDDPNLYYSEQYRKYGYSTDRIQNQEDDLKKKNDSPVCSTAGSIVTPIATGVAGGLLGSLIGGGSGRTVAIIAGTALGTATGAVVQNQACQ